MKKELLLVFALCLIFAKNFAQVNASDSLALVDLYNSTDGANWTNKSNWLTTAPLNTWYGVTVENDRVTDVLLPDNNLNGTLPNSLGNLTNLVSLQLHNNQLQNKIPVSLGFISSLSIIDLSHNQLSGELPDTWVQTNMEAFVFSYNQLSGPVPPSVCSVNGYFLFLNNNQFTFEGMECIANLDPDPNELNEV
ncbi:MAG TPA: hypothetical protein PLH26_20990, partial [Agriterribacter sp.]|nr:hypothetical protein [Agriterribacter sp.]